MFSQPHVTQQTKSLSLHLLYIINVQLQESHIVGEERGKSKLQRGWQNSPRHSWPDITRDN